MSGIAIAIIAAPVVCSLATVTWVAGGQAIVHRYFRKWGRLE